MKFDYKEGMIKREILSIEQNNLLDEFIESIKQPFREWYKEVDKSKVEWLISQFLLDCGYQPKKEDFMLYFIIPPGTSEFGLKEVTLIVKQYSVRFMVGEQIRELTLATLRGD